MCLLCALVLLDDASSTKGLEHIIVFFLFFFILTNNSKSPFNVHTKWKTNSFMTVFGWVECSGHSLTNNSGMTVCFDPKDPQSGFKLSMETRENKSQCPYCSCSANGDWRTLSLRRPSSIVHRFPLLKWWAKLVLEKKIIENQHK